SDLRQFEPARQGLGRVRELSRDHQAAATVECLVNLREGRLQEAVNYLDGRPDLSLSSPIISRVTMELERRLLPAELPALRHTRPCEAPPETAPPRRSLVEELVQIPRSMRAGGLQSRALKRIEQGMRAGPGEGRRRRLEEALGLLRRARELDPTYFRADFYLGEALLYSMRPHDEEPFWMERLREARECFMAAWRNEGENPYLFHFLGRVSLYLGEVDASIHYHDKALERFAKFFESDYSLGQCHLLLGDEGKSLFYFARSLRSDTFGIRERINQLVLQHRLDPEVLRLPLPEFEPESEIPDAPEEREIPVETPPEPAAEPGESGADAGEPAREPPAGPEPEEPAAEPSSDIP
ncbi:MAG: tetratricopeptide repeat protein, partial [Candidatus Eremiobacterota bacterium]